MNEQQPGQVIDAKSETLSEVWAYVEIMGHSRTAGRMSERKFGVAVMLQVDVPNADGGFSHSELYSPGSIFSIKPTTEAWCRSFIKAGNLHAYEILPYVPKERQLTQADVRPEGTDDDDDPEMDDQT
jgi:hypothetical protein